jgi:hypothetical protein
MANLRHEPCARHEVANAKSPCAGPARIATCLFQDLDLPSAISPLRCAFCYARVMAWRSLFEVRLNAGVWYINSQQQYRLSKCWGSFDFSTADEKVAPALFDAAIISLVFWTKTAERSRARTQE